VNREWLARLRAATEAAHASMPVAPLAEAVERLSRRYRDLERGAEGHAAPALRTAVERLAYVTVRMPATATVLGRVLSETRARLGDVRRLLDLGAGPLTSLWAATAVWPGLDSAVLVDRDAAMLDLGLELWTRRDDAPPGPQPEIVQADIAGYQPASAVDLVLLSYVVGELGPGEASRLLSRTLSMARRAVVIVEPGTPHGFAGLRELRRLALAGGAFVAAPCPHDLACPMQAGDWCHFAARVERSRVHRLAKHGELGWEDEKFAYLVLTPVEPPARAAARILRHPSKQKGHVLLRLCRYGRAEEIVVPRRAADYRAARHAAWGGAWPLEPAADDADEPDAHGEAP
jgi:ribosomal protein RSM22 (predicted rRNA methylase)